MKTISLAITLLFCALSIHAQDTWEDYILGKPMKGYIDAKKATAQQWGLNYKAIFAGCIMSEKTQKKQAAFEKSNALYFKKIAQKRGEDWQSIFRLDVGKEMNRTVFAKDTAVWLEIVQGRPNIAYFEAKETLAKKWGIHYKAVFLGCDISQSPDKSLQTKLEKSAQYLSRLNARLGDNWQDVLEKEVQSALIK